MTDTTQPPQAPEPAAKTREQEIEEHMSSIHNGIVAVLQEKGANDEQAIAIMSNLLANWVVQGQLGDERVARLIHVGNSVQRWVALFEQQQARTAPQLVVVGDTKRRLQ